VGNQYEKISTNLAENALRPIALGRKNWMFLGHESGGETIAIISTLIASCRRHHVDPYAYLKTVIRQLTENQSIDPAALMPDVVALDATRQPSPNAYSDNLILGVDITNSNWGASYRLPRHCRQKSSK
jgi:hypothetical protein